MHLLITDDSVRDGDVRFFDVGCPQFIKSLAWHYISGLCALLYSRAGGWNIFDFIHMSYDMARDTAMLSSIQLGSQSSFKVR